MMHTAGIGIIVAYIICIHTNKTRFSQIKLPTFELLPFDPHKFQTDGISPTEISDRWHQFVRKFRRVALV